MSSVAAMTGRLSQLVPSAITAQLREICGVIVKLLYRVKAKAAFVPLDGLIDDQPNYRLDALRGYVDRAYSGRVSVIHPWFR